MSDVRQGAQDSRSDTGFLGQPGVLANLFGVELWERFSFYGMQGILLIYLYYSAAKGGLGIDESNEAPFFLWVGLASVVTGVLVMLASKPIHRLMAGVD